MPLRLLFLLTLALAAAAPGARAQDADTTRADTSETRRVEIIRADSLTGGVEQGEPVRRLAGDVRMRQGATRLRSRRATQYEQRGEVLFLGDVLIVEEGDSLRADTVYYDTRQKIGRARGRMRLSDGEVVVRGPEGRYFTQEKRAEFERGVTLIDSTSVLTSRAGRYFTDEKRAEFYDSVRLTQDRAVVAADSLTYFRENETSRARGRVVIERFGDEDEDEEPSAALRRLVAADTLAQPDTLARTLLFGDRAFSDRAAGFSRVRGNALLLRLRPDSAAAETPADTEAPAAAEAPADTLAARTPTADTLAADTLATSALADGAHSASAVRVDTLLMRAEQIQTSRTDTLDRLIAVRDVRVWQRDLAAVADSAVYDQLGYGAPPPADSAGVPPDSAAAPADTAAARAASEREAEREEETRLFRAPMAWAEQAQLSGDTLRITGRSRSVDSLFAFPGAFVAQRDTALGRIHQLQGQRLVGYFEDDSLRTLTVGPNAEAVRFLATEDGTPDGAVEASSDQMVFLFAGGALETMRGTGGIEGVQYPEEALPDPLQLSGYVWRPNQRPTRAVLLDPRVDRWLREGRVPVAPAEDQPPTTPPADSSDAARPVALRPSPPTTSDPTPSIAPDRPLP